jgi:drug/metabolite transporter (DMT)-like permease
MRFIGELAALGTAFCWALGSNFVAAAGRTMGPVVLNRLRLSAAALLLAAALVVTHGSPWPHWASGWQIGVLALSGLVGFVFGDIFYFRSILILGPGRGSTLACLAPPFTALLAIPVLGEHLGPLAIIGMTLTVAGVAWTVSDHTRIQHEHFKGSLAVGIATGALGALGQAVGFILSKVALREGLDALSATVVRVTASAACMWILAVVGHDVLRSVRALRHRGATASMVGGAFFGPFLGVTLLLFAVQRTEAGVAASIGAFYPIPTILISSRFHRETVTLRTFAGAAVAITGIVLLFLR